MKYHKPLEKTAYCYDCGAPYTSFVDIIIPDYIWEKITPSYTKGSGILCPTCICERLVKGLGLSCFHLISKKSDVINIGCYYSLYRAYDKLQAERNKLYKTNKKLKNLLKRRSNANPQKRRNPTRVPRKMHVLSRHE